MSLCQNCDDTRIEYVGNGVQRDFTFPFEYNKESDIEVAFWDETTETWSQISDSLWNFQNATTIRFNTAPANGQKLAIYRCTDIDPLPAEFYPGTPIKAQDLNDNFFVLKNAVEEAKCAFGNTSSGGGGGGGPVTNTIKYSQQVNGQADSYLNDSYVFSASASAARHDSYVQPNTPLPLTYEQDGKIWNDTNALKHYFWDADNETWVNWSSGGSPGPEGPAGPPGSVIVSDSAPVEYVESGSTTKRPLRDGDLWFDSYNVLLYMWYTDATSGQWVSVSIPGPKGDSGSGGGGGGDFSGDYNDLTNKPTIGDGIITIKQGGVSKGQFSVNQITPTEILLDAGGGGGSDFSGDYNDLTNKPTIGAGVITINQGGTLKGQFNVNQTGATTIDLVEGDSFSGDYNDLTNKPTIPTVGNGIITVNQGGVQKGQFTTNQSNATNINLDAIPTVGNGIITITQGGVTKGTFSVNQTGPTTIDVDAGGGATGDFVKLDDGGTAQTITGGGGLNVEFGTAGAQLGNIAPMNDWSCYPART